MTIKSERIIRAINQLKVSIVLLAISISSLILSFISITCSLLPKAYYFLPISLVPSILVGVFHFIYNGKFDVRDVRPEESKALKKALKSATQLTLCLVTTSFSGFIGDLLGIYHKAEKLGGQYSYAKVSIFFMLGSGLAGILALLLCRLLSSMPALLLIAATILHGLLVPAVVFPVVAGAAAWAFIEFCTAAVGEEEDVDGGDGKAELGTMYAISVAVLACCGLGTVVLAALALFYQIGS
uniref:Uncharacterized protein n=1 Tax=Oryza barthii TaxID=65489 RepID=A0A0D3GJT8_9ORYZ